MLRRADGAQVSEDLPQLIRSHAPARRAGPAAALAASANHLRQVDVDLFHVDAPDQYIECAVDIPRQVGNLKGEYQVDRPAVIYEAADRLERIIQAFLVFHASVEDVQISLDVVQLLFGPRPRIAHWKSVY